MSGIGKVVWSVFLSVILIVPGVGLVNGHIDWDVAHFAWLSVCHDGVHLWSMNFPPKV